MPGASGTFETRQPGYYPESPETFWDKMAGFIHEDPKKLKAKAQNALAFSESLDIAPSLAYEYHDDISESIFGEKLTSPELVEGLAILPITAALATSPLGVLLGFGAYQAVSEVENAAVSLAQNKKYQIFRNRGISELLPEDASEITREIIDTIDFIGKGIVGKKVFSRTPKLGIKIARKIIVENKLPRELYVNGEDLKAELQRGGILPVEEMEMIKALGLKGNEYRKALNQGLTIKIPAEKIITITDRPWYAKVKKILRISPYEEVRVISKEKPTAEFEGKKVKEEEGIKKEEEGIKKEGKIVGEKEEVKEPKVKEEKITPEEERMNKEIPSPKVDDITKEVAEGVKKPKTRIRLITGQTKLSDLVREDVAFKATLRKAAKEARHALSVGKAEGYKKAKTHYLDLREKVKQRIAQRRYIQKLITNVTKPLGNNIDFYYKQAIEDLKGGIDFHFRSEKTIQSKERMKTFFTENLKELNKMPPKFIKELDKKPLNNYTIDDLQAISEQTSELRKLGKLKRSLILNKKKKEFENVKEEIILAVSKGEVLEKGNKPLVKATRERARLLTNARIMTLRPSRIFDKLDGGKQFAGPLHKFFYDEVNKKVDESYKGTDKRFDKSRARRKEIGIDIKELSKTREIDGIKYTVDEMLDIYAGWKNPRKRLALIYGNHISEEIATKVASNLSIKEKTFANEVIAEYERNYDRVRKVHIDYTNEDMGYEPNYTPLRRMEVDFKSYKSELAEEILLRKSLRRGYVTKQFTLARKDIPREYQKPIFLGLYSVWLDQVPKQERYIHLGGKVKEMQKLTSDLEFREVLRDKFGLEYIARLEAYNNRVANPSIYKSFGPIEKISQKLRRNMVMAYLSYNLVTMGKQLPSVLLFLPEAGPKYLIASALTFASNPFKMIKRVNDKDPQVKHRMIERELEEMQYSQKIIKMIGKPGMKGIRLFDRMAVTIGWNAVYNKNIAKWGEAEAVRLAKNATLRTQPAAHPKDLAELYTTNEFLNWMLQFTNQLNQIYNIASYDIPQDVKSARIYKAFLGSLALSIVGLTIWTMANRRLPDSKEDIKEAFKEEVINSIPLLGKNILAASQGYGRDSTAMKFADTVGGFISNSERDQKAKALLEAAAVLSGIPYTGTKRIIEAVKKEDVKELFGKEKGKERKRY